MRNAISNTWRAICRLRVWLPALLVLFMLGAAAAYAQTGGGYDLTWWTVDTGGEQAAGGSAGYTSRSTAGQPDADPAASSGGGYTLLSGFWPSVKGINHLFLPIVLKNPLPDLVGSFSLSPDQASYAAGTPVLITAVVTNAGSAAAGPFWVDFYINPSRTPAVNVRWNDVCGMSPCYGLAWYVPDGLGAGQSVTLTSAGAPGDHSIWPGHFAPGTTDLYLYVDSWNPTVSIGGVMGSNENNNLSERHGLAVTGLSVGEANLPSAADLAPRPARLGQ